MLLTASRINGVAPLVFRNLTKVGFEELGLPEQVIDEFSILQEQNVRTRRRSNKELQRAIKLLNSLSVPVMIIKGEALSRTVYQERDLISMADIDLLLEPKEEQLEPSVLQQIKDYFYEVNFSDGQVKELFEFDFYMHHDLSINGILPVDAERIWRDSSTIRINGGEAAIMTIEDTLIASAINSCRKRYFRLKSCFDLAEIIDTSPELDWDLLLEKANAYRCSFILYTALWVTKQTVGLGCEIEVFERFQINWFRKRLIQAQVSYLTKHYSLLDLLIRADISILGRKFSQTLFLTYASYRWNQVIRKIIEIINNRKNRHGWDPGSI